MPYAFDIVATVKGIHHCDAWCIVGCSDLSQSLQRMCSQTIKSVAHRFVLFDGINSVPPIARSMANFAQKR